MQKKTIGIVIGLIVAGIATVLIPLKGKVTALNASCCNKEDKQHAALSSAPAIVVDTSSASIDSKIEEISDTAPEILLSSENNESKTHLELVSNSFGHAVARQLKKTPGFQLDISHIIQGMNDEIQGIASPMTDEEYETAITQLQEEAFNKLAQSNLESANDFLEKNAEQTGIVCMDAKLQYQVLHSGEGQEVTAGSTPLIHYTGSLVDGTVFGSSYDSEDPIPLPIGQTIPGFSKGLMGMKEGEKRRLFIHPELAYGITGHLPPNSLLIFDVEIVKATSELNDAEIASLVENEAAEE